MLVQLFPVVATFDFDDVGHSDYAMGLMQKFVVGRVPEAQPYVELVTREFLYKETCASFI